MRTCFLMVWALLVAAHCRAASGEISGRVLNENNLPFAGAWVIVNENGVPNDSAYSDVDGKYAVMFLKPGSNFEVIVRHNGYITQKVTGIVVGEKQPTKLNFKMKLDEKGSAKVVVVAYKTPLIEIGHPHGTLDANDIKNAGIENRADPIPVASPGIYASKGSDPAIDEGLVARDDHGHVRHGGLLTSGEVNDFSKWKLWGDLSKSELRRYRDAWKLIPRYRYTVMLKNENNIPVCNAHVAMKDRESGIVIWEAVTDNTGKAELWDNMYDELGDAYSFNAEVIVGKRMFKMKKLHPFSKGINIATLPVPCDMPKGLDIAFIVDATGSMQDEINYLKDELYDIIGKVRDSLKDHDLRLGTVFYRDEGDEYLTKVSKLSDNIDKTIKFIKDNDAGGGGDEPEAVDVALDTALRSLGWSKDALTRIAFLVLDAPPHSDSLTVLRMQSLVARYANRGIRLVPIVCSGSDKNNEYLMRSLALSTNGTFIFLTDHSGIGGHHTEASTDKYDVEYMNRLVFKTICQFAYITDCDQHMTAIPDTSVMSNKPADTPNTKAGDVTADTTWQSWRFYPNPCSGILHVDYGKAKGEFYISDVMGKLMLKVEADQSGKATIKMTEFPSGVYFIRYQYAKDKWMSGKFMLMH